MSFYHAFSLLRHYALSDGSAGWRSDDIYARNLVKIICAVPVTGEYTRTATAVRNAMLTDRREIVITDLGTGGHSGQMRKVSDIAAASSLSQRYGVMLARLVSAELKDEATDRGIILELGTSLGISSLYMAAAAPCCRLITVEGCKASAEIAAGNFRSSGFADIRVVNDEFSVALRNLQNEGTKIRFAFIDGNHTGEALEEYFNTILEMAGGKFTIVADDIHNSRSMHRGWERIKKDRRVMLSVETLRLGILTGSQSPARGDIRLRC